MSSLEEPLRTLETLPPETEELREQDLINLAKKFNWVRKFSLSSKRLLMWNDWRILVGSIDNVKEQATQ